MPKLDSSSSSMGDNSLNTSEKEQVNLIKDDQDNLNVCTSNSFGAVITDAEIVNLLNNSSNDAKPEHFEIKDVAEPNQSCEAGNGSESFVENPSISATKSALDQNEDQVNTDSEKDILKIKCIVPDVVNSLITSCADITEKPEVNEASPSSTVEDISSSSAAVVLEILDKVESSQSQPAEQEVEKIPLVNGHRGHESDVWTDDEDSSSSSSSDDSFLEEMRRNSAPKTTSTVKTKGELEIEDLPPIEELSISVQERELTKVGHIHAIVTTQVVVSALKNQKPLDLDSVLFLSSDKPLGRIFDVFGPVVEPFYIVRFNSPEDIVNKGVTVDLEVYYAPQKSDITSYVFVDALRLERGSDASWKDNNEPPEEHLDYSDDEQERMAKLRRKGKNRNREEDDIQLISNKKAVCEVKPVSVIESRRNNPPSNYNGKKYQQQEHPLRSNSTENVFRRTFKIEYNSNKNFTAPSIRFPLNRPSPVRSPMDNIPVWITPPTSIPRSGQVQNMSSSPSPQGFTTQTDRHRHLQSPDGNAFQQNISNRTTPQAFNLQQPSPLQQFDRNTPVLQHFSNSASPQPVYIQQPVLLHPVQQLEHNTSVSQHTMSRSHQFQDQQPVHNAFAAQQAMHIPQGFNFQQHQDRKSAASQPTVLSPPPQYFTNAALQHQQLGHGIPVSQQSFHQVATSAPYQFARHPDSYTSVSQQGIPQSFQIQQPAYIQHSQQFERNTPVSQQGVTHTPSPQMFQIQQVATSQQHEQNVMAFQRTSPPQFFHLPQPAHLVSHPQPFDPYRPQRVGLPRQPSVVFQPQSRFSHR